MIPSGVGANMLQKSNTAQVLPEPSFRRQSD